MKRSDPHHVSPEEKRSREETYVFSEVGEEEGLELVQALVDSLATSLLHLRLRRLSLVVGGKQVRLTNRTAENKAWLHKGLEASLIAG